MGGSESRGGAHARSPGVVAVSSGQAAQAVATQQQAGSQPSFASWIFTPSKLRQTMTEWAKASSEPAQRERLTEIAVMTVPKEYSVWALYDPSGVEGGPGLYLQAPRESDPDVVVVMHAVDKELNVVHHVGVRPGVSPFVAQGVLSSWARSFLPKRCSVQNAESLRVFGLQDVSTAVIRAA
mmetsp:Transcript_24123/g.56128  ORF Transcript_24123/g.56128 Transcript_24123/m.56128 type:complete len:181 (+) Transcript_24123:70-612(+)